MVETCPHCGALIPPPAHEMPHLTPHEFKVYCYIAKRPECSIDDIVTHVYASEPDGGPLCAKNIIFVYITRINHKLTGHKIVNIASGYPARYRLTPEAVNAH